MGASPPGVGFGAPPPIRRYFPSHSNMDVAFRANSLLDRAMALIADPEAFRRSLASLPIAVYVPGETVLDAGSTTGHLYILRKGVVEVIRDGLQIATVSEPGAVFGELSVILDKPHTADVRALERSEFHVAEASSLLTGNLAALLYVSATLARRLDSANEVIVEIKQELESGERPGVISKALGKLEKLLSPSGANTPDFFYYYL
jgi:CRP-like cAMP-binding protein